MFTLISIDGVLIRGKKAIPEAKLALDILNQHQIPWILLTNGGGQPEKERADKLSNLIGVKISDSQVVQAHTPFRGLAQKYHRVLVVGGVGDNCRHVAEKIYGFQDVVIPADIVKTHPSVSPFSAYSPEYIDQIARPRRFHEPESGESKIDAILVFNDPRDLSTDLQITLDLLLSRNGYVGTLRDLHSSKKELSTPSVPIYFCCNDLLWANNYPLNRFGQGAFRIMVERLYSEMTHGAKLQSTIIGKPYEFTYKYANSVLKDWRAKRFGITDDMKDTTVFMVGDNPASDIMGGNNFGWHSLLVRTGVFRDEDLPTIVAAPKKIVDNVKDAVEYGIAYALHS